MNPILKTIKERRSIRKFKMKPIPEEILEDLKEALIWAPSAHNFQARKFFFIFDRDLKNKMKDATWSGQPQVAECPLLIVACVDLEKYGERRELGEKLYGICDISASLENLMLYAHSAGLGTCWIGAFDPKKVKAALDLPDHLMPVAMTPVGYPDEEPKPKDRVIMEEAIEEMGLRD